MAGLTPGSPIWWTDRLHKKLVKRRRYYQWLECYESGDHPLPEGDARARDLFKAFQRKARTNYCGLVVSSVRERLHVTGFRTGGETGTALDEEMWRIYQANHLDADSDLVHDAALTYSDAYVIVGGNDADPTTPVITVESPLDVIGEPDPINRRKMIAGLKTWVDESAGLERAVLYLPTTIHYFQRKGRSLWVEVTSTWEPVADGAAPVTNPRGRVPLIRFVNRPKLREKSEGMAEFEDAIDIQDRINLVVLDRLIVSKTQAYRQRWIKGLPTEDEDGNPIDLPFVPGVDLLWAIDEEPGSVELGEFSQVDLTPILKAAEADVKSFVTVTGLPPHYVAGDLVNASADALAAAEARLVARIADHQRYFGESWEEVLELAAEWAGLDLPEDTEIVWAAPERKTDAQLADAAVKKDQAGVPWEQRMEDLNYSPPQIKRMRGQRVDDAMVAMMAAPPQQPPAPAGALSPAFQQPGAPVVTGGA